MFHRYTAFLLLLLVCAFPAEAQLFPPFTSFRVIKTEKFDIIYPKESEPSARLLASFADSVYNEVSSTLGIQVPVRIPVTLAPHTDMFNGYYNPISIPHIVLYDTAIDIEWTTFEDNLRDLFRHELTHAVSLNSRGPFYRGLRAVFGNWAAPTMINAPLFMVEGVTVSFESSGGFGRANDPLTKQKLRQAIYEGKFLSPFQASGVYDLPDQSGAWYEYGGLFSSWLQKQYGMEKYAQLWQAMGKLTWFSFSVYKSAFYRIFKNVYGMNFVDTWNTFRDSLALNGLEENPDNILPPRYRFFTKTGNTVSALAAGKSALYILDQTEEKIKVYDTGTKKTRTFNTGSVNSNDLDVSASGKTLLVSGYHVTGDRFRAVVTEYSTDSGSRTGRNIQGLYKARYFRDGVIGIANELHNNCIVYDDFKGNREILFRGNEELMFSGPQVVDNDCIVFIAACKGKRELLLYNFVSGELFRIENSSGDNEIWQTMRGLNVSEGKIFFSHNINDRMYKIARIDLDTMQAIFSDRDFSGGVFNPVSVGADIYYRGNFFSGDSVLRFPESAASLSGTRISITLTKLDAQDLSGSKLSAESALPAMTSKPYIAPVYMNPFRFWLPIPLLRYNFNNGFGASLDGGGIISVTTDPTDRNTVMLIAYADAKYRMAMVDNFTWQTTVPGIPLTVNFSDKVITDSGYDPYRDTRVNLYAGFTRTPGRWSYGVTLGGGYARSADDNGGLSAYEWEESGSYFYYSAALAFSNLMQRQYELFGTGLLLKLRGISAAGLSFGDSFTPRYEGMFQASAETRFPLRLSLYGAYDTQGMNIQGTSRVYGDPVFANAASQEYPTPYGLSLSWLGGGEVSAGLFSFEIQGNLSHLYFNRLVGALSLRNVLYDGEKNPRAEGIEVGALHLAQSLVFKLQLVSSIIPLKSVPFFVEPNIWGAWKFSDTITGKGDLWNLGIGFNLVLQ